MGANPRDFQEKLRRIRAYLEREGFAAMLLARRDSFAWATLGGDNKVLRDTPVGAAVLLCTRDRVYLVAQSMDADRIRDDELAGLPVEPVTLRWYDPPPAAYAASLAGGPVVSDTEAPGCEARPAALRALHLPYTPWEVQRFEAAGAFFDETFLAAAETLAPGMTERAAAALLAARFEAAGAVPTVLLVGSDERIARYRHPLPSGKPMERTVLLHVVATYGGVCCAVTRMVTFGPAPEALRRDYDLLNRLQADAFSRLIPGRRHGAVLEARKRILEEAGRLWEYGCHFPGADIDYSLGSPAPFLEDREILPTQCYDIYLTVTGCKVEELAMAGPDGARVLSRGPWPTAEYAAGAYRCRLPVILER